MGRNRGNRGRSGGSRGDTDDKKNADKSKDADKSKERGFRFWAPVIIPAIAALVAAAIGSEYAWRWMGIFPEHSDVEEVVVRIESEPTDACVWEYREEHGVASRRLIGRTTVDRIWRGPDARQGRRVQLEFGYAGYPKQRHTQTIDGRHFDVFVQLERDRQRELLVGPPPSSNPRCGP